MEVKYELSVANILALMRIRLQRSRGLRNPVIFPRLAYLMGFSLMALGTWLVANQVILLVVFIALAVSYFFPNDSTIIVVKEQIANDEFISFFEVYGENISAAEHRVQRTRFMWPTAPRVRALTDARQVSQTVETVEKA